jgi:hypothetical protein
LHPIRYSFREPRRTHFFDFQRGQRRSLSRPISAAPQAVPGDSAVVIETWRLRRCPSAYAVRSPTDSVGEPDSSTPLAFGCSRSLHLVVAAIARARTAQMEQAVLARLVRAAIREVSSIPVQIARGATLPQAGLLARTGRLMLAALWGSVEARRMEDRPDSTTAGLRTPLAQAAPVGAAQAGMAAETLAWKLTPR